MSHAKRSRLFLLKIGTILKHTVIPRTSSQAAVLLSGWRTKGYNTLGIDDALGASACNMR